LEDPIQNTRFQIAFSVTFKHCIFENIEHFKFIRAISSSLEFIDCWFKDNRSQVISIKNNSSLLISNSTLSFFSIIKASQHCFVQIIDNNIRKLIPLLEPPYDRSSPEFPTVSIKNNSSLLISNSVIPFKYHIKADQHCNVQIINSTIGCPNYDSRHIYYESEQSSQIEMKSFSKLFITNSKFFISDLIEISQNCSTTIIQSSIIGYFGIPLNSYSTLNYIDIPSFFKKRRQSIYCKSNSKLTLLRSKFTNIHLLDVSENSELRISQSTIQKKTEQSEGYHKNRWSRELPPAICINSNSTFDFNDSIFEEYFTLVISNCLESSIRNVKFDNYIIFPIWKDGDSKIELTNSNCSSSFCYPRFENLPRCPFNDNYFFIKTDMEIDFHDTFLQTMCLNIYDCSVQIRGFNILNRVEIQNAFVTFQHCTFFIKDEDDSTKANYGEYNEPPNQFIQCSASFLNFINCTFHHSSIQFSTFIFADRKSSIMIDNCTFDCNFLQNQDEIINNPIGMDFNGAEKVTILNSHFFNFPSSKFQSCSQFEISKTFFNSFLPFLVYGTPSLLLYFHKCDNISITEIVAQFVDHSTLIYLSNCINSHFNFLENQGFQGIPIKIEDSQNVFIENAQF
jgi:hypothetical protein